MDNKLPWIQIRIDKDIKEQLKQRAKYEGLGVSAFVRRLILQELRKGEDANQS